MAHKARYRIVPNTPTSIALAEEHGFEVRGYSEYSSDGFPSKAELVRYEPVPDIHRNEDDQWYCRTCGGVGGCSCLRGTKDLVWEDPICDCGQLASACGCSQ